MLLLERRRKEKNPNNFFFSNPVPLGSLQRQRCIAVAYDHARQVADPGRPPARDDEDQHGGHQIGHAEDDGAAEVDAPREPRVVAALDLGVERREALGLGPLGPLCPVRGGGGGVAGRGFGSGGLAEGVQWCCC